MKSFTEYLNENKNFDFLKKKIKIDWDQIDEKELKMGIKVELEHGSRFPATNVTNDDYLKTAKIALAHLLEDPKYYTKLKKIHVD